MPSSGGLEKGSGVGPGKNGDCGRRIQTPINFFTLKFLKILKVQKVQRDEGGLPLLPDIGLAEKVLSAESRSFGALSGVGWVIGYPQYIRNISAIY